MAPGAEINSELLEEHYPNDLTQTGPYDSVPKGTRGEHIGSRKAGILV